MPQLSSRPPPVPWRLSPRYTDVCARKRPPTRVPVLEAPCVPGASLPLERRLGPHTQPLPFASSPASGFASVAAAAWTHQSWLSTRTGQGGEGPHSLLPWRVLRLIAASTAEVLERGLPLGASSWPSAALLTHRCTPVPQPGQARPLSVALGATVWPGLTQGSAQHCAVWLLVAGLDPCPWLRSHLGLRWPLPLWSPIPSMPGALCSGSQDPAPSSPSSDSSRPPALRCGSGGVRSCHGSSPFSPCLPLRWEPDHPQPGERGDRSLEHKVLAL